jgi:DNA-binding transcriptional regulator YiaG
MNSLVLDHAIMALQQPSTSGDGVLRRVQAFVIRIGGTLTTRGTATAEAIQDPAWLSAEQTNSGLAFTPAATSQAAAISELRRRSGLTWDQLARLFGVARRSVHFWMSGKALNASNEERLNKLLVTIRHIDRGGAGATRAALMSALPDGAVPFELLAGGEFDEVRGRLGQGRGHDRSISAQLHQEARREAMLPTPDRLVGALQDSVHRDLGGARAARTAKAKKRP